MVIEPDRVDMFFVSKSSRSGTRQKQMKTGNLFFVKKFLALAVVVITAVVGVVFVSFHLRTERLTENILLQQGRALFDQLILTRGWVSQHEGVYVKVRPGVDPNPFLLTLPNLKVNLNDEDGTQYTLMNPGLVIRGISELAEKSGQFRFHVASLTPVNKKTNTPDPFERKALEAFAAGSQKEAYTVEQTEHGFFYRYMAPLIFEEKCNRCHASEKLTVGDIRGGISVSIPMEMVNKKLKDNRAYTLTSALIILGVLFTFLFVLARKFIDKLSAVQEQLVLMATIDDLTKLFNRKVALQRLEEEIAKHLRLKSPLSCLMLDIDHFKSINDRHGHQAGDAVLQEIAGILQDSSRKYDIVCRYGGEEFMIVLPSTDFESARTVAEKIRGIVSKSRVVYNKELIKTTVSIGVAQLRTDGEEGADGLIKRADDALYEAKNAGRDRVIG